ncbi:MAG: hypothetical protein AAF226_08245 [Verrucomicrobiota bacterium]
MIKYLTLAALVGLCLPHTGWSQDDKPKKKSAPTKSTAQIEAKVITIENTEDLNSAIAEALNGVEMEVEGVDVDSPEVEKALKEAMKQVQKQLKDLNLDEIDGIEALKDLENGKITAMTKTMVIGPDGKMKELSEDESISDALEAILADAKISGSMITGLGPAFAVPRQKEIKEIRKELGELKGEMAEQRKLLEAISAKLDIEQ